MLNRLVILTSRVLFVCLICCFVHVCSNCLKFSLTFPQVNTAQGAAAPLDPAGQSLGRANPAFVEDESFRFTRLCVRAEEAERQLRVLKADDAVLKSKQAAFVDRENFLLSEMQLLSSQLLCKSALRTSSLWACLFAVTRQLLQVLGWILGRKPNESG